MNRTTLAGKVSNIEVKQSKDGTKNYLSISIEYGFIKQDGNPQVITYRASVFNDSALQQYAQGLLRVGCYIVAEATASASTYQAQDTSWKAAMNYTINSLTNLSIRDLIGANQPAATQPAATLPAQANMGQVPMNMGQAPMNMGQQATMQQQAAALPNINNVTSTQQLVGYANLPNSNGYNGGGNPL